MSRPRRSRVRGGTFATSGTWHTSSGECEHASSVDKLSLYKNQNRLLGRESDRRARRTLVHNTERTRVLFLSMPQCQEEKYEQYVTRRLAAENREPFPTDRYANYEAEVQKAGEKKRILRRQPTPITWCIRCNQERCKEGCGSGLFEREAATLRGDTPVAAPAEEGYSSSETIRPRGVLYSTALVQKIETRNKAVQTGRPRTRNKATQTEAEALPLQNRPFPSVRLLVRLVVLLIVVSVTLAIIAALPGADARPLSANEHFPSSPPGLLRAIISVSLVIVASKFLVTHAAAADTDIPELPEHTTPAVTPF